MSIIEPEELGKFIEQKMQEMGMNIKEFAAWLGVSRQEVHWVLSGTRPPAKKMLHQLNIEIVYRIDDGLTGKAEGGKKANGAVAPSKSVIEAQKVLLKAQKDIEIALSTFGNAQGSASDPAHKTSAKKLTKK